MTKTTAATQWPTVSLDELTAYAGNILPAPDPTLTAQITADGITDPLHIVRTSSGDPQIIDGRRRAAAAHAAGLTEVPYSPRPMIRVDALTAHPHNARTKAKAPREMVESVRIEGVRIPLKLHGARIIDGHLRYDAARRAGCTHVPYEVDERDEASQQLDMVTTAHHRQGLTLGEAAAALFRADEAGADIKRVARAAGLSQRDARKAIRGGRSQAATRVASTYTLTLDQMAALADLAEQAPEAAKRVEEAAAKGFRCDIGYLITREATAQARRAKAAAHRAKLEKAGARISEAADLSDRAQRLTGEDAAAHARSCKGHVWVLEHDTDEQYTPYCANAVLYEHTSAQATATASGRADREAEKAARRAVKSGNLDWDAATEMRRQWLSELLSARTTPAATIEAIQRVTARILMTGHLAADRLSAYDLPEILAGFLGVSEDRLRTQEDREKFLAKVSPKRAAVVSFAILAAGFEAKARRDAWRTDSQRNPDQRRAAARYFGWLTELGYEPQAIEAAVRDDQPYNPDADSETTPAQTLTDQPADEGEPAEDEQTPALPAAEDEPGDEDEPTPDAEPDDDSTATAAPGDPDEDDDTTS